MGAKTYIGIDGIARKVKNMYIGIGGVARKVKKAYIGVNGVARKVFGGDLEYVGTADILSQERYLLAATTVGDYALFGGGFYASFTNNGKTLKNVSTVDAYDKSLTRTTATSLSQVKSELAATTVGDYALFGGGSIYSYDSHIGSYTYSSRCSTVDAYDKSLTRTTATSLSQERSYLAATTVGNYALFGGGYSSSFPYSSSTVDAYDTSLTRTTATSLSQARGALAATTVGDYALFGGGDYSSSSSSTVDAYDASLTRTTATNLSQAREYLAATTVGDYALFGGGSIYTDAYDTSLTRTTATSLSQARCLLAATTVGDYALFGGGKLSNPSNIEYSTVDAYDTSLTRTTATNLSQERGALAATTVGDYALFGGGGYHASSFNSSTYYLTDYSISTVDAYDAS